MEELEFIISQYSPVEIFLIILFLLVATKTISTIFEWFYHKVEDYFSQKKEEEEQISELESEHDVFNKKLDKIFERLDKIDETMKLLVERMQENTKTYIIDKYHYYYEKLKAIDDAAMQNLELRYMYYKSAGGDSYIDDLMERIRELPRINIETIQQTKGVSNDPKS